MATIPTHRDEGQHTKQNKLTRLPCPSVAEVTSTQIRVRKPAWRRGHEHEKLPVIIRDSFVPGQPPTREDSRPCWVACKGFFLKPDICCCGPGRGHNLKEDSFPVEAKGVGGVSPFKQESLIWGHPILTTALATLTTAGPDTRNGQSLKDH